MRKLLRTRKLNAFILLYCNFWLVNSHVIKKPLSTKKNKTPIPPPDFNWLNHQILETIGKCKRYTFANAKNLSASIFLKCWGLICINTSILATNVADNLLTR